MWLGFVGDKETLFGESTKEDVLSVDISRNQEVDITLSYCGKDTD